ncbi:hypothetical protein HO173_005729 [Letharia columbiana]|uniref:Uncharacterized protein n=1 Tax=Letharia columbiana TaxID=112416 RepID=A0A8H6FWJ2_9LECA|nr:uncharacterized protein HO173_005729 [Letharia columbiana]KAF6236101.1 hypothetical protein HO173_005729 [Letharia columbiana]
MPKWTIEEEIVLLYYASRQVKYATIADILAKKCHPNVRTVKQITHKAARLRKSCGQKEVVLRACWAASDREWDRKLADQWLFSRMEKAKLVKLLEFDGETAAIIDEKNDIDNFVDIMFLHDGETADQPDQPEKHEARTARHNL